MYLKIKSLDNKDDFSWKLCKNPLSVFDKDLAKEGRKVYGKFIDIDEYETYVENNSLTFLKMARDRNLSFYLNSDVSAVCPYNLKGLYEIFRSVMRGSNSTGGHLTDDQFLNEEKWEAVFGPFKTNEEHTSFTFNEVGMSCEKIEEDKTKFSYMYKIKNNDKMSLTEFLQKLYIVGIYLGYERNSIYNPDDEQIAKFINISKNWLNKSSIKNKIIKNICRYKKELIKLFEESLIETIDDEFQKEIEIEKLEDKFNKQSLHEKRHNFVIQKLKDLNAKTLMDLGSSEGSMIYKIFENEELNDLKITAIEANRNMIQKIKRKSKNRSNVFVKQSNILFPNISENDVLPDFLTCVELIEHLNEHERKYLLKLVKNVICPKYVVLTTPNVDYNKNYGLADGEYRRKDHVIEYNKEQFENEVINSLSEKYDIENINLLDEEEQPTFVIFCKWKEDKERRCHFKELKKIVHLYDDIYLPISDYTIRSKELADGFSSKQTIMNIDNIFYLAPTIAPVEYSDKYPEYIEHPSSAFEYFRQRGITQLVEEVKYMGSRAYIIIFKDEEMHKNFGLKHSIVINSRAGYPFFEFDEIPNIIRKEIIYNMKDDEDFVILDAEILPWCYKADRLITKDFTIPGECTYLDRKYTNKDTESSEKFIETINHFASDSDITVRPFHVLAIGRISNYKNKYSMKECINGLYKDHKWHVETIQRLTKDLIFVKPCEYNIVNLDESRPWDSYEISEKESVERWIQCCDNKLEGFVYKPYEFINHLDSGYLVQPALKVRGKDYLRLVYGIDLYDEKYFNMVKNRKVNNKRSQAIQQFEISSYILQSFLNQNHEMRKKYIAAFIGSENINKSNIDATL